MPFLGEKRLGMTKKPSMDLALIEMETTTSSATRILLGFLYSICNLRFYDVRDYS